MIYVVWWGFGSCHSLGVAVGLLGYGMCQVRGAIRRKIFLKKRRVGCFFLPSPNVYVSRCQPSCESHTCPSGKSLLAKPSAGLLEN